MRWAGPASALLHGLVIALLVLFWRVPTAIPTAPAVEVTLLPPAEAQPVWPPPPPPPPQPPELPRVEIDEPEPLPEIEKVEIEPPPPAVELEPEVVLLPPPKPKPKRPRPPVVPLAPPVVQKPPEPMPEAPLAPPSPPVQIAAAPTAPAIPSSPAPAPPGPVGPPPSYLSLVVAQLEKHKHYPIEAQVRNLRGVATLRFTLARDGRVKAWKLLRSTGYAMLDRAVEQMLERANPLPPIPPEMNVGELELVVPVSFRMK